MRKESAWKAISSELPYKVRIDKITHERLKELKKTYQKSMAQIIIGLVDDFYRDAI